ncbi:MULTISPECIES: hypothetical protein [Paenibacillus]|uniref:Uncharacterized protein n=1 Tax=Paenibacillus xylanilyticus TaxID=248903 RepID=A0A7Y6BWQ9_9BACL|nr:hypothetical protein [Paenibacillus xylanilyticus]NUU76407.1 hypothetical protein [Paenibacillus xylanilyticus]
MEMLIALIAILGMGVFYALLAYYLIRLISKKAFRRTITKVETIEILVWLAIVFFGIVMIVKQTWHLLLPVVLLLVSMINLRRSNRKYREMNNNG